MDGSIHPSPLLRENQGFDTFACSRAKKFTKNPSAEPSHGQRAAPSPWIIHLLILLPWDDAALDSSLPGRDLSVPLIPPGPKISIQAGPKLCPNW